MDFTYSERIDELERLCESVARVLESGLLGDPDDAHWCCAASLGLMHLASRNAVTMHLPLELVEGRYDDQAHWWVECLGRRFDATVNQFPIDGTYTYTTRYGAGDIERVRYAEATNLYMWAVEGEWDLDGLDKLWNLDPDELETQHPWLLG